MVLYSPGRTTSYPDEPVEEGIRLHFLGGGDEVGNVGCVLEDKTGTRILIDYGLAPTKPPKYPSEMQNQVFPASSVFQTPPPAVPI